ncbi:DUF4435 domain-containing protein [Candidatus Phyllobacterium onerii]|uniref:DUF4435 domain-containing protein n=1 Tax=Candidatus Phyllobacterium onerii TaxID=3020828 RepID=UPI003A8B971D
MISYSARAVRAIGFLKAAYNDIEIFVEDTANPTMWLRLIQKLVPPHIRLESVTPLRGRDRVVDACRRDQQADGRRRLYIIDGDYDHLLGRKKPRLRYLHRLRAYCSENIIVREQSLVEIGLDCSVTASRHAVATKLDYQNLIETYEHLLRELFIVYAATHLICSKIQTVGISIMEFTSNNLIDPKKIRKRMSDVIRQVRREGKSLEFSVMRKEARTRASSLPLEMIVSGKDYIFPIVYVHMRSKFSFRGNQEQLKVLLAREFQPLYSPHLSLAIRRSC